MQIMESVDSSRNVFKEPNFVEDLSNHGQILAIELSTFEWSQDLILIGFEQKILLGHLNIADTVSLKVLNVFSHPRRCTTLCFSPETSLITIPNQFIFCAGGSDFKLRIYKSDLLKINVCKVLNGHLSFINDTAFDPRNTYLASSSDDNTVKIWSGDNYELKTTFNLTSAGLSVCWHVSDSGKLLVAEKIGTIRFYNVESETPILSLDYGKPLSSCHWAPSDQDLVTSLQLGELLIWEATKPCLPTYNSVIFPENGGNVKFSPHAELIAAVNGLDGFLKVVNVKSQNVKLTASVSLPTNVCWHYRFPLVCLGDDFRLCFWKVTAK